MSADENQPASEADLPSGPYAALKYPGYLLFVTSGLMAVISGKIQFVALAYEVYQRTGRESSLGWLAAAIGLPMLLLGLLAGQLSDMFNRKRIVIASQLLSMGTSVGLALVVLYSAPLYWMYICATLRGVFSTFGRPARQALLPQIIPMKLFPNAVTWSSSTFQMAMIVGPAIAGTIIALGEISPGAALRGATAGAAMGAGETTLLTLNRGVMAAFIADALALGLAALCLALVPHRPIQRVPQAATFQSVIAGFRFVFKTRLVLATITLDLFAVLLGGASYLLPVFASEKMLGVGPRGLGWMEAAPALGAICMAVLLAHLPPLRRAGRALLWAVAGFGVATIIFGISKNYTLSLAMLFMTGAFDNISVVVRHTLVQTLCPDHMRGRVSAVNSMFIGASNEMGGVESAVVAALAGPVFSVVSGGIGTLLVVLAVALLWPELRRIGRLQDVGPEQAIGSDLEAGAEKSAS